MATGRSNAILVSELLAQDGPHGRVADDFVKSRCTHCGGDLSHDPRYGEWGAYCARCLPAAHAS